MINDGSHPVLRVYLIPRPTENHTTILVYLGRPRKVGLQLV